MNKFILGTFLALTTTCCASETQPTISPELAAFESRVSREYKIEFSNDTLLDYKSRTPGGVTSRTWKDEFYLSAERSRRLRLGYEDFDEYDRQKFKFIVLHYTASPSIFGVTETFHRNGTSAHFLVENDGKIFTYVDPYKRVAYHAGSSSWAGRSGINHYSIGIEHSGLGYTTQQGEKSTLRFPGSNFYWYLYPEEQFVKSCVVTRELQQGFKIPGFGVVTHADIAPDRKSDIGPAWNYKRAYEEFGTGYFPSETHQVDLATFATSITDEDYINLIGCFGYGISEYRDCDVVRAYQMHVSTSNISGELQNQTREDILKHAISLYGHTDEITGRKYEYFQEHFTKLLTENSNMATAFAEYLQV